MKKPEFIVYLVMLKDYNILYSAFTSEKSAKEYIRALVVPEKYYVVPFEVWK